MRQRRLSARPVHPTRLHSLCQRIPRTSKEFMPGARSLQSTRVPLSMALPRLTPLFSMLRLGADSPALQQGHEGQTRLISTSYKDVHHPRTHNRNVRDILLLAKVRYRRYRAQKRITILRLETHCVMHRSGASPSQPIVGCNAPSKCIHGIVPDSWPALDQVLTLSSGKIQ